MEHGAIMGDLPTISARRNELNWPERAIVEALRSLSTGREA
jgi:hypothetical protein